MKWTVDQLLHLLGICEGKYDAFEKGVESIEAHMKVTTKPAKKEAKS